MKPAASPADRDTFLQNLQQSKLLSGKQYRLVVDKLRDVREPRQHTPQFLQRSAATQRVGVEVEDEFDED